MPRPAGYRAPASDGCPCPYLFGEAVELAGPREKWAITAAPFAETAVFPCLLPFGRPRFGRTVTPARTSHSLAISGFAGEGRRSLFVDTAIASGVIGRADRVSGVNWLLRAAHRCELPEQRPGPHDPGAERLHSIAQLGVGCVDEQRSPVPVFADQVRDSVIRSIPAAMSRVDHGEAIGRRRHGGRLLPVEHDRPCATVADHRPRRQVRPVGQGAWISCSARRPGGPRSG